MSDDDDNNNNNNNVGNTLFQQNNSSNQLQSIANIYPSYAKEENYYQLYWNMHSENEVLIALVKSQIAFIEQTNNQIQHKKQEISRLEEKKLEKDHNNSKKKKRRTNQEIEKNIKCPICQKMYATEVALNLHKKRKHESQVKQESSIEENSQADQ